MFDPVSNPFAIQHLLQKEQDHAFQLKSDGLQKSDFASNTLLNEIRVQPSTDFQADELLDPPFVSSFGFQSDENETQALANNDADRSDQLDKSNLPATPDQLQPSSDKTTDKAADIPDAQFSDADAATPSRDPAELALPAITNDAEMAAIAHVLDSLDHPAQQAATDDLTGFDETAPNADTPELGATEFATAVLPEEAVATAAGDDTDALTGTDVLADDAAAAESAIAAEAGRQVDLSNEAMNSLLDTAREEARMAGYQEGLQAGIAQAQSEMQQAFDDKLVVVKQLTDSLQHLTEDPNTLFEPFKKLAMHLAEQLVRGELAQSAQVISRLVDNCLRELAGSGEKAVIIHLNPEDLEQYKPLIIQFGDSILLRPDSTISRGSVRASLDGSVVEDLIERRVKGLTKSLSQPVATGWRPAASGKLVSTDNTKSSKTVQPAEIRSETSTARADEQALHESVSGSESAITSDDEMFAESHSATDSSSDTDTEHNSW